MSEAISPDQAGDVESAAEQARVDAAYLQELFQAILPDNKNKESRYASFLALELLSEQRPEILYPYWEALVDLLRGKNNSSRYNALHLIANLAVWDPENRFAAILDDFFRVLDDESLPLASHAAGAAGKIARAKPALEPRITRYLLKAGDGQSNPGRRDLVRGYALDSFAGYYETAADPQAILGFVIGLVDCASTGTRKKAKQFLKDRGIQ